MAHNSPDNDNLLQQFLKCAAPDSMRILPAPFPPPPILYRNTQFEYAIRLVLEGREILDNGDSLVKTFSFDLCDIKQGFEALNALQKCFLSDTPPYPYDKIAVLPNVLKKIITYHIDKGVACNVEARRLEDQLQSGHESFEKACSNRDFNALALFYPYSDGVLEINDYSKLPRCLEDTVKVPFRAARLKLIFENVSPLKPAHVSGYLGRPEFGVPEGSFVALNRNKERNMRVWSEAKAFINSLTEILTGKPAYSDPISLLCNPT